MALFQKGLIRRSNQSAYLTLTAAVGIDIPTGATHVILQARTKAVYYSIDGTTPTAGATSAALYQAADTGDIIPIPDGLDKLRVVEAEASASITYMFCADRGA